MDFMSGLEKEIIDLIVATCNVEGPLPQEVSSDAPLFGPESLFGLDSLDAVEVAVAIQKKYNKRITDRNVMRSLDSLANFVRN
jgi:acyl carrier protein